MTFGHVDGSCWIAVYVCEWDEAGLLLSGRSDRVDGTRQL